MRDFRQVHVWQKAHRFTLDVYRATKNFPRHEEYGLTRQLRRSCSSIGANIAEGCGRSGDAELCRFLQIAMGSASETDNHLLLARDLGLLSDEASSRFAADIAEIKRMLAAFIRKLKDDA